MLQANTPLADVQRLLAQGGASPSASWQPEAESASPKPEKLLVEGRSSGSRRRRSRGGSRSAVEDGDFLSQWGLQDFFSTSISILATLKRT